MKIIDKIRIVVLLTLLALCIAIFSTCKKPGYGTISVSMKDAPANYQEVNIDLQSVEIFIEGAETGWYKLNTHKGVYNLLLLQSMPVLVTTVERIPSGKIARLRFILGDNNSIKENNNYFPLQPAKEGDNYSIIIPAGYSVSENSEVNILIDFDAARSVFKTTENKFILKPVIVSGKVNSPYDLY